tara:strand:- start:1905 stop:2396 length:492 start_codon:yes stop_codon:yes gene_type:complete
MAHEVIDNFLAEEDHKRIADTLLDAEFPWFYNSYVVGPEEEDTVYNYQFTHQFYAHYKWNSEFSHLMEPIVEKLRPRALIRIKANLSPVTNEIISGRWHTDYAFECKTAVYYVNTNNGFTKFRTNQVVESVANRMVIFDSHDLHTGATATDVKARCVVNFNYL